jgi:hypothetical protein
VIMTTKTITQLPSASDLQGNELLETVQVSGGFPVSVKTTMRDANQAPQRYIQFDQAGEHPPSFPDQPWKEGLVQWDRNDHTLKIFNDQSEMAIQVGQETVVRVRNTTGSLIVNGSPCYISGGAGDGKVLVGLAKADNSLTLISVGVATHDIPNNSDGYITKRGMVRDLDTSSWFAGQPLWVSPVSAGVLTTSRPVSPHRANIVGLVVSSHAVSGQVYAEPALFADEMKMIGYTLPLSGVTDVQIPLVGIYESVGTSATGDVTSDWDVGSNHVFIKVNSLTVGGDCVITGDSISESTGIATLGDTETITFYPSGSRPAVNRSEHYQTSKKWLAVTNIDVSSGTIAGINFNYGKVGYPDMGNRNFRFLGYRLEAYSDGIAPDMRFIWQKIDGEHGRKIMHIHTIEDIGIDSDNGGDQIIDHFRKGADNRNYNSPLTNLWDNGTIFVFKQLDLDAYFAANPSDEYGYLEQGNDINAKNTDSGYIIRIEGEPEGGGISNVQYINLILYYELS